MSSRTSDASAGTHQAADARTAAVSSHGVISESPAASAPQSEPHVITYTEVVLAPEWLESSASRSPQQQQAMRNSSSAAASGTSASAGSGSGTTTSAGVLTGSTHFIVRQPDGAIDVGIHTERLAELKAAAAHEAAARPADVVVTDAAAGSSVRNSLVLALQGSEHRAYTRRRLLYCWLMAAQFILYIVLTVLCGTLTHDFVNKDGSSSWGSSAVHDNWIRDFAFAFSSHEAECFTDMAIILVSTAVCYFGALMCRPLLLMIGLAASFLIFVLGTAAVLSPVILMRIILLVLGFQVRAGILRWHHLPVPPFLMQLRQHASGTISMLWSRAVALLCCQQREADTTSLADGDLESPAARPSPAGPRLNRSSVSLQLGDQIYATGQTRQLLWNRGEGLSRDSPILLNATRARIIRDAAGRPSLQMSGLASVAGTASGNQAYR